MHYFKYENNRFIYENNVKIISNYHPRAHFIIIYNNSSVFTLHK